MFESVYILRLKVVLRMYNLKLGSMHNTYVEYVLACFVYQTRQVRKNDK